MGLVHSPKIVTDGLVLALDAGNVKSYPGSGTTWYDKSGNGYNYTLYNTPSYGGNYLDFTTNEFSIPSSTSFTLGDNYTICTYVNFLNDNSTWRTFFRTSPDDHPLLVERLTNNLGCYFNKDGSFKDSGYDIIPNIWYHITILGLNGITNQFYINGVQEGNTMSSNSSTNHTGMNWKDIGNINGIEFDGNQPGGKVGLIQVYNRALSASEILQNYNATKSRFGL